jgi:hypothetical protein
LLADEPTGRPTDLNRYLHENFDCYSGAIRLPEFSSKNFVHLPYEALRPVRFEPRVPFAWTFPRSFHAVAPFDLICLTKSPSFTPREADEIYNEIRGRFIIGL